MDGVPKLKPDMVAGSGCDCKLRKIRGVRERDYGDGIRGDGRDESNEEADARILKQGNVLVFRTRCREAAPAKG